MSLELLRQQIDELDEQIIGLLNRRMEVVKQIGQFKRDQKTVVYRPEREKFIIERLDKLSASGLLNRAAIEAIYLEIFAVSRHLELSEKIAYLGPEGSFCHQAAESRFGAISTYFPLPNISSVFEAVTTERVRFGVVPIENNQEGTVQESIDRLLEGGVQIVAELALPIHFSFASQQEDIRKIKRIYSKDIAFGQCRKFLNDYAKDIERKEVASTSLAAKLASEDPEGAALCAEVAAKLYNLPVLFSNVQDSSNNRTRFLILSKTFSNQPSGQDKSSFVAQLSNEPGSLANLLNEFNSAHINLNRVESRPAREGNAFNYKFLIECDGHVSNEPLKSIVENGQNTLKWIGSYVKEC